MADSKHLATLQAFQKHLATLRDQLQLLQFSTNAARKLHRDNVGERSRFLAVFESAYGPALMLLKEELRAVIPESAVSTTAKAWCVETEKTLDRLARWFRQLAYVGLDQSVYPPVLFAAQRNHFDGVPMFGDIPQDAEQQTQNLVAELNELSADMVRFYPEVERTVTTGAVVVSALATATNSQSEERIADAIAERPQKPKRKKRDPTRPAHRPPDTDATSDAKIANEWLRGRNSGEYLRYDDMARKQSRDVGPLAEAIDRDRKRRPVHWRANRKPRRKKSVKSI